MADEVIKTVLTADSAQLRAEFDKASAKVRTYANNTRTQMTRATGGVNKHSQGLLQMAQFADDAQYGIRGVLNNIPGLVMGFGAGAGVAGAISLAVLAAAKLGPLLKDLYTDTEAPKIKAAADALAARYRQEIEAIRAVAREKEIAAAADAQTRDFGIYAARELRIQDQRLAVLAQQRQQMELMRGLQDRLNAARGKPGAGTDEVTRAQEDLELARRGAKLANEEYNRVSTESANVKSAASARLAAAEEEIRRLERNIAGGKATLAGADEMEKQGLPGYGERRARAQATLDRDNGLLAEQKALVESITRELKAADALSAETLGRLSAQIDAETRKKLELEKQIPVYKEIAELQAKATADAERAAARVAGNPLLAAAQATLTRTLETRGEIVAKEAEGVALLRRKALLEKRLEEEAARPAAAASRIRRSQGIGIGSGASRGLRIGRLQTSGLRESAAERAYRERPRTPAITPEKGLEARMLEELEGINGALQKLGLK